MKYDIRLLLLFFIELTNSDYKCNHKFKKIKHNNIINNKISLKNLNYVILCFKITYRAMF